MTNLDAPNCGRRPPHRRGCREHRTRTRRDPRGRHRQPRRARRCIHPQGHRRPAQARTRQPRCLLFSRFPPAWLVGTAGLSIAKIVENMEIGHNVLHGQWDWMRDPNIHSTTWEWDTRPRPRCGSTPTTNCTTPTPTCRAGTTTSATASCGSTRARSGDPFYLAQPLWNFINACLFQYGIAAYDLELGKHLRGRGDKEQFRRDGKKVLAKIRRQSCATICCIHCCPGRPP